MASFPAKTVLFLNLSVLLLLQSSVQASYQEVEVYSGAHSPHSLPTLTPAPAPKHHEGHHHHQPSTPPIHVPAHPPVHPPTLHPPVHPPAKPPVRPHPIPVRKLVAVQGVVYCKNCKFVGVDTLWKAKPLEGAVVKLTCNNTKYKPVEKEATTDKNGYFLILAEKVTNAAYHKCRVSLVKSPSKQCDVPTNFKDGWKGATLTPSLRPPSKTWPPIIYELFTVGPFAYEPSKKISCTR